MLGIYFSPISMTKQQYDTCIQKLEAAGAGKPAGRLYHASFTEGDSDADADPQGAWCRRGSTPHHADSQRDQGLKTDRSHQEDALYRGADDH
jgi:hypothetical protein